MVDTFDLEHGLAIKAAHQVDKIVAPLKHLFELKHFRYLKLYGDGSRILLSNYPDCTRYMYSEDRYRQMWFDGEFPEFLKEGHYAWNLNRLIDNSEEEAKLEQEINTVLGLYHGLTFVIPGDHFYEVFSFDTEHAKIYHLDKSIFFRFISYFKEQAGRLIAQGETEKILIPLSNNLFIHSQDQDLRGMKDFLEATKVNRYYLTGKYHDIYLTTKEMHCVYWLIQGKSAEEIALIDGSQTKTVECHFENIRRKLGCYKQTQLVKIVLENGMLDALLSWG